MTCTIVHSCIYKLSQWPSQPPPVLHTEWQRGIIFKHPSSPAHVAVSVICLLLMLSVSLHQVPSPRVPLVSPDPSVRCRRRTKSVVVHTTGAGWSSPWLGTHTVMTDLLSCGMRRLSQYTLGHNCAHRRIFMHLKLPMENIGWLVLRESFFYPKRAWNGYKHL